MKKVLGITGLLILLALGSAYGQSGGTEVYSYYLPYFTEIGGTWTGLGLRNSDSAETAHVSVIVYTQNGNSIEETEKNIPPGGQDAFVLVSGKGNEGWIRVNSDRPLTGLCFFGTTGIGSHMADITLIPDLSKTLHVPHVGQNYQWDTAIMVCNPNPAAASVTLTFRDKDGDALSPRTYTIPANGSAAYNVSDLTGSMEYVNGSVELAADQGLAAFALYTDLKWNKGMSFAGISAVIPEPQTEGETYEYYLPYFIEGSENWTGLALRNSGDSQNANITVTVYDQKGNASEPVRKSLSSKGQDAFVVSSTSGKEGWIRVNSDCPMTGLCFFGTTGQGSRMADITLIPALSKTLYVPHVGQNFQWDTTIMICNPNAQAASFSLTFRDKDGQSLSPRNYTISANGSGTYKLSDLTGNTEYVNGSVEISADQGLAAFALYTDIKWNQGMSFAGISAISSGRESGGNADYPRTGNQDFKVADSEKSDPLFAFRSGTSASNLLSSKEDFSANIPNVKDQGNTGSCTAWATGYYYKTWQEAVEEHWDKNQNAFSPMYLFAMQCRTFEQPYDMIKSWEILKRYGCAKLLTVPFKEYETWSYADEIRKYGSVSISDAAHEEAKIYRSGEMTSFSSLGEVKQALTSGPVVMGISQYERTPSDWSPSPERNYLSPDSSNYNDGHAILCVGYDDSKFGVGAVKIVNSWGTQWGEKGYTWIRYSDFDDIVSYAMSVKDLPNPRKPSEETKKKPDAPEDVQATDATGPYVDITWSNVGNAQYYRIFRAEVGKSSTYKEIASSYGTSYRDFPEPGIVFYYSLVSYNDIGSSDHFASDTDAKSYVDKGSARGNAMIQPKVLWVSNDDREMSSSFTVSNIDSGAEAMEVLVANNSTGPWDSFGWIEPGDFDITWGDDSEYAGKKPFVKVIVSNADGYSESSTPAQVGKVIASAVNVASVYSFTASTQNNAVSLSWIIEGGSADFFEVWRWLAAEDEGNEWILIDYVEGKGSSSSYQYIDSGALPGKDYYYAVCAVYQGAYSEFALTDEPVEIAVSQSSNLYLYDFGYEYGEISNPVAFEVVVWNDGATDINDYSLVIWAYDWDDGEIYQLSEIFPASLAADPGQLPLRAGYEHVLSFTFNVPDEFADGHFYSWGIEVDASRDIAELYEDDNFLWSADGWWMSSGWRRSAKESSAAKIGRARLFAPKNGSSSRKKEENFVGPIRFKKPSFCIDRTE